MAMPVLLIVAIAVVDVHTGTNVHLGPLLVIAPALTASFGGPWMVAAVGALAELAQIVIAALHGGLTTTNHIAQMVALALLSALIVFYCAVRERRVRQLAQVQSVAEAAQQALLRPLPQRIGPLRIASLYLAAEDEAHIGGDLYTATRVPGGTRMIIGDVRGKGLAAIGESALLLGAFRQAATQHETLPSLAAALDHSVCQYLNDFVEVAADPEEHFTTALLLDLADDLPLIRMTNCGHPPPLLLGGGTVVVLESPHPAPPLGIHGMGPGEESVDSFRFGTGDILLLYTDGVIEARNRQGEFYPLADRVAQWTGHSPEALLHHLHRDLLAHAGGRLGDDAALIAVQRMPVAHEGHHLRNLMHTGAGGE
ncbi:PP2C family protein-serine/threonine phosphatase [Streptomyces orinoci]|uniref:PP2C family protein-serine/threonine phosphatase n=1 Tax=Streptomyces orinoci TaxID=67339 RepID=A0ABV3K7L0_STRON|nr:PP2C family protein-serine/threonine phosphatase [Streptomyces orinoci]